MRAIYTPKGAAREYGEYAVNPFDGCPHGCLYCYVPGLLRRTRADFHRTAMPRPGIIAQIKKDVLKLPANSEVFMSFTCDPYPRGCDTTVTREAIEVITGAGHRVKILTKNGGPEAERDFDLMTNGRGTFGVTLTVVAKLDRDVLEPGAALPEDRIRSLMLAQRMGMKTWVSLEPVITPLVSENIIERTHEYVDFYAVGKLNHHPHAKTTDWHFFGHRTEALLKRLGKKYLIKNDLRKEMRGK